MVYQEATGNWYVVGSSSGFFSPALNFGGPGFTPVAGDYDGDGVTDPAVYQHEYRKLVCGGIEYRVFQCGIEFWRGRVYAGPGRL